MHYDFKEWKHFLSLMRWLCDDTLINRSATHTRACRSVTCFHKVNSPEYACNVAISYSALTSHCNILTEFSGDTLTKLRLDGAHSIDLSSLINECNYLTRDKLWPLLWFIEFTGESVIWSLPMQCVMAVVAFQVIVPITVFDEILHSIYFFLLIAFIYCGRAIFAYSFSIY